LTDSNLSALDDKTLSALDDKQIIELYLQRCENAINETSLRYNSYCTAIAMNILHNQEDSAECVNDAFLQVWNSIPPQHPTSLSTFIGKITRNLALNKYKAQNAKKRGGNNKAEVLSSELEECVADIHSVEDIVDNNELAAAVDEFLSTLKEINMIFFIRRYWHGDCIEKIASSFSVSEGKVLMSLFRTRKKLKTFLEKRGISL